MREKKEARHYYDLITKNTKNSDHTSLSGQISEIIIESILKFCYYDECYPLPRSYSCRLFSHFVHDNRIQKIVTSGPNVNGRRTMEQVYTEGETFNKVDFTITPLVTGEYDNCTFINCDFSNSDLSEIIFLDCKFEGCNMSMAKLINTVLRDIKFSNCKMLGLQFETCNESGLSAIFGNCNLSHSSFYKRKLRETIFKNLILHEVDFTGCDLTGSVFDNCNLKRALFENSNLEKTDFRTSVNYSLDPEKNRMKGARFSLSGIAGLLDKHDIEIEL
jgi:fluoroquinolone resistance protein